MMTPRLKLRQRGASLIEILVAVLIVTFGILALAALQANSVRYNKTSELRTVASLLAKDMADRMRANVTGVQVLSYNSSETTYANAASTVANETMANIPTCDYPVVCSAQQIAAIDLAQWRRSLAHLLTCGWFGMIQLRLEVGRPQALTPAIAPQIGMP